MKNFIKLKYFILFDVLLLVLAIYILGPANIFDRNERKLEIPKGASTKQVQQMLEENRIIRPFSGFAIIAKVFGVSKHIQAGEYRFSPSDPMIAVLIKLRSGDVVQTEAARIKVTFPEGYSIYKMGDMLKKNEAANYKTFQGLVKEGITANLRKKHWGIFKYIPSESLEGYLYPDTYWFYANASAEVMAEIMLNRFEEIVVPFWEKASKDTKMSLHEIVTLASIVEKEARRAEERAIISSVYHNRLAKNMFLDACPTVKYALDKPTKKVYTYQLKVDSEYNTYKQKGLPPGPICNPGIESIKAAVYPAKTNYYYFVAKKDGSHIFSATWEQHQRARVKALTPTR